MSRLAPVLNSTCCYVHLIIMKMKFLMHYNYSINRCCFICVFVLLINTASPHEIIEGVEGESIILPCSHRHVHLNRKHLAAHWRHNDTRNVYDIIHGRVSVKEQDPAYNNRTSVSPEGFRRGNFSLTLEHLQRSDGGMYLCYLPAVGVFQKAQLVVKERSIKKHRFAAIRSHSTKTTLGKTVHLLPLVGFILHVI